MAQAHAVVQRRQPPGLQAGADEAPDCRVRAAEDAHVLRKQTRQTACDPTRSENPMTKRTFKIYRYDPDTDAKPYMQTIEVELDRKSVV